MLIPDSPDELLLNPNLGLVPDIDGPLFGLRAICGNLANHMCPGNMVMRLLKDGLALLKSMKHVHDLSMASNTGKKACGICGKAKPLGQFHWLKTTKSYHSYCKPCLAVYMRRRARRKAKETKVCGRCGEAKPAKEYYRVGKYLHAYCKPCCAVYARRRYLAARRKASKGR